MREYLCHRQKEQNREFDVYFWFYIQTKYLRESIIEKEITIVYGEDSMIFISKIDKVSLLSVRQLDSSPRLGMRPVQIFQGLIVAALKSNPQ